MARSTQPLLVISVVLEGYNQSRRGDAGDTLHALARQDYPLDLIEIILVGSSEQVAAWRTEVANTFGFKDIKFVACDNAHYYQMKNAGAKHATGEIVAFTDSDVRPRPGWARAIVTGIENGADVTVGPSLFRQENGLEPDSVLMRMAATITWGWILGRRQGSSIPAARGFQDHNVGMRTEIFRDHQYREEFGRILASPLLFRSLANSGKKVVVCPDQQAEHHFTWRYWLIGLEFRYGHEVFRLRRLDQDYPNQWISRTGPLEPLVTLAWHVLLDMPKWFRFNSVLKTSIAYTTFWFPFFVIFSTVAHLSEMLGIYSTMLAPAATRKWAETV
jgi:glycosyltransferase involved in cell wall biosynthesis